MKGQKVEEMHLLQLLLKEELSLCLTFVCLSSLSAWWCQLLLLVSNLDPLRVSVGGFKQMRSRRKGNYGDGVIHICHQLQVTAPLSL